MSLIPHSVLKDVMLLRTFAGRFVDDAFGFALTWNYWFNDAVSIGADLVAL
jgi:amino acid permease